MHKVQLTYFKVTGKYYSEGLYTSEKEDLGDIWDEVRANQQKGSLPGLMPGGGKEFIILIDVPDHEHTHPRLIV